MHQLEQSLNEEILSKVVTASVLEDRLKGVSPEVIEPMLRTHADQQMASLRQTTEALTKDLLMLFEKNAEA
eukprot:12017097-Karenia_brevis.AAC.1